MNGNSDIVFIYYSPTDSDNSSGDEFYDSDDSCNSADTKNNIAILVGPPGCGKTCAVYMLANELGFKVVDDFFPSG